MNSRGGRRCWRVGRCEMAGIIREEVLYPDVRAVQHVRVGERTSRAPAKCIHISMGRVGGEGAKEVAVVEGIFDFLNCGGEVLVFGQWEGDAENVQNELFEFQRQRTSGGGLT